MYVVKSCWEAHTLVVYTKALLSCLKDPRKSLLWTMIEKMGREIPFPSYIYFHDRPILGIYFAVLFPYSNHSFYYSCTFIFFSIDHRIINFSQDKGYSSYTLVSLTYLMTSRVLFTQLNVNYTMTEKNLISLGQLILLMCLKNQGHW